MNHRVNRRAIRASLAVLSIASLPVLSGAPRAAAAKPKLAVLIVVDQMRADYVDRFKADWTGGFNRLVTRGAWFRRAAYPYLSTVTCAGHATISTGTFPHLHGVLQNAWWDRDARKLMTCTEDPDVKNIGYTTAVTGGDSPHRLQGSSFADEMRRQLSAHVVSLSVKDRSAIMLAGHGGDAVTWLSTTLDGWVTSSAFTAAPVPAIKAFVDANPIDADYGKTWTRLLPDSRYRSPDDAAGEAPPAGWTKVFPHVLKGAGQAPDADFHAQWERSPYADAYLGRFAAALTDTLQLGKHDGTDVLAVSFSSPDLVGHAFGPDSQEEQDMLAQLDRTLGTLFDRLDALVGPEAYVVALTADHGVTPIPEQLVRAGKDGGRIDGAAILDSIEQRARAALGAGTYVSRLVTNDLYFEPGMYDRLKASPSALKAVIETIAAAPGIERVFRSEELATGAASKDRLIRAAALSYFPGRGGDLVIAPKAGWMAGTTGTTHGSANADDQRVPILLMGAAIKPGEYKEPATPADVAPTLAAICGISMPKAEGHALGIALR
jgi:predicted AlkP superfamily pyrophosphatase or phosphodiesterase